MPGTLAIDAQNTFEAALLMASAPKPKFGGSTGEISTNAEGIPQYTVSVAVTYRPGPTGRKTSEVISLTIASPQDPAKDIPRAARSCSTSCAAGSPSPRRETTARASAAERSGSPPAASVPLTARARTLRLDPGAP